MVVTAIESFVVTAGSSTGNDISLVRIDLAAVWLRSIAGYLFMFAAAVVVFAHAVVAIGKKI